MNLWPVLLGMAAVTFALRASFLVLPPGIETPALLRRALRYVPPAVLTAIWRPRYWWGMNNSSRVLSQ